MTKAKTASAEGETETVVAIAGILHITPAADRRVRKPDGIPLADKGEPVNVDGDETYWLRRSADGDVVISLFSDGDDK